jgi:sugar diacid utilization regulator
VAAVSARVEAAAAVLTEVTEASAREHDMPPHLLHGYPEALLTVARTGRRLSADEEAACRRLGGEAAAHGSALPAVVDLYMTASRRLWPLLPELLAEVRGRPFRSSELVGIGEAVWRAADSALAALATGYVEAQRDVVRREEAFRRQFVDDLLTGRSDLGSLVERAEQFGLTLTAAHLVVVVGIDRDVDSGMSLTAGVADAVRLRFGSRGLLVEATEGRLVCVLSAGAADDAGSSGDGHALAELCGPLVARLAHGSRWRVGVGRPHQGPHGVLRSYREAVEAFQLAERLDLAEPIVQARDLLVYRVLLRDEAAIADLVETVLGPLTAARGGAEPLVLTLEAYYQSGGNAAAAARRLFLSVRALTYRLQRVQELTGYAAGDPAHHLPLLVAVTGARLLDWPARRLASG